MNSKNGLGEVINLGSNFEISIKETVELIAEIMGVTISIAQDGDRLRPASSEVERLWADNSKAKEILNWKPRFAGRNGLKSGLEETIAWFSQPENLSGYKSGIYNL